MIAILIIAIILTTALLIPLCRYMERDYYNLHPTIAWKCNHCVVILNDDWIARIQVHAYDDP